MSKIYFKGCQKENQLFQCNNTNFNYLISILKLSRNLRKKVPPYWGNRVVPGYKLDIVSRRGPHLLLRLPWALTENSHALLIMMNYDNPRPQLSRTKKTTSIGLLIIPMNPRGMNHAKEAYTQQTKIPTNRYYFSNQHIAKPKFNYKP